MKIILNEREYIKRLIDNKDLGQSPFSTICMVARYYYSLGYKPKRIKEELEHFMIRCDSDINLVKWSDSIDKAVSRAKKRPLVEIDSIPITQKEIDICKTAGESAYQRLAFTMLCLAKFFNLASGRQDGWVNLRMKEIFSLANIQVTKKRQALMIGNLSDTGLTRLSKRIDNTNSQVLFVDNDGAPVMEVFDIRDLGYQYERFLYGEKDYPKCQICGKIFKRNPRGNKPRKYCNSCGEEVERTKVSRWRFRQKNSGEHRTNEEM